MRVLHLAYRDTSGVPGRWAAAHRAAGLEAELLVEMPHPFGYAAQATVLRWTPGSQSAQERRDRIAQWLDRADVVMAYDHPFYLDAALATGKPVLFRALGQSSRQFADEITSLLREPNVMRASTGTADLSIQLGIEMTGAPFPLPEPADPQGEHVFCHAPSDREAKGTERILRAAEDTGWQVDLLENASNSLVMERKRTADLLVDTCGPGNVPDGYGVNGVEAMALGLPVVASASPACAIRLIEAGSPVVLVRGERELRHVLLGLYNEEVRSDLGALGRSFVGSFHSPETRAAEDLAAVGA